MSKNSLTQAEKLQIKIFSIINEIVALRKSISANNKSWRKFVKEHPNRARNVKLLLNKVEQTLIKGSEKVNPKKKEETESQQSFDVF